MQNIKLVSEINKQQIEQLLQLYSLEFWCNKRKLADVERMLSNTDIVIGAVDRSNNLVGFVRILTDYVYKATLYDLIVHRQHRDSGIGTQLMDAVIHHPLLQSVEHFDLHCLPQMVAYYNRWGFTTELGDLGFMRRFKLQE